MDVKERALSISVCMQWLANFVIAEIVPAQVKLLHADGTFLFYAVCCLVSFGLVYAFVPETKGVALEDMDSIFGRGSAKAKGRGGGNTGEVDCDNEGRVDCGNGGQVDCEAGNSSETSAPVTSDSDSDRSDSDSSAPESATSAQEAVGETVPEAATYHGAPVAV
jgi:hypothetical protein